MPKRFTTWSPMLIAGIGSQADTIEDRSIILELRRKLVDERIVKCPVDLFERQQPLRRQCLRWAEDNIARLKLADFEMPDCGNDRAADNWFPLFAIARLIGEPWRRQIEEPTPPRMPSPRMRPSASCCCMTFATSSPKRTG